MESMKKSISITIEKELVTWIDQQVKTQRFRNRSHLVELALMKFRENEEEK
jgi:Arc/MetJ-type ribon-helix-helix transcriptional regulator